MGMSASANLIFGVLVPQYINEREYEVHPLHDDDIYDIPDWVLRDEESPYHMYPSEIDELPYGEQDAAFTQWKAEHPEYQEALDARTAKRREITDRAVVDFEHAGHYDADERFIFITLKAVRTISGDCWDPTEIVLPEVSPELIAAGKVNCEELGLPTFEDPKWWLVASYG